MTEMVILDFGSGNTCKNDKKIIQKMYNKLRVIDNKKYKIVVKWQLFEEAGNNVPLNKDIFDYAYKYGKYFDYEVTSSVFSLNDLKFLLNYEIPFVKIANNRNLDKIVDFIDKDIKVLISSDRRASEIKFEINRTENIEHFFCISKYPASIKEYEELNIYKGCNISDHTDNFDMFNKYNPKIIEWHYKLNDSTGFDSGDFARTPEQLKEIL